MQVPVNATETAAVVAAVESYHGDRIETISELSVDEETDLQEIGRYAVVPQGKTLHSVKKFIDEYRDEPERRAGTAELATLDSFIEHARRFADEDSAVFADVQNRGAARLVSVLDYHEKGAEGAPRFCGHKGVYQFPLSDEWKAWNASADHPMAQATFAQFIEDRIMDVKAPEACGDRIKEFAVNLGITLANAQRLMELSKGLTLRADIKVSSVVNLSSGEGQMMYAEAHGNADGSPLKIPGGFAISIPVVRNGPLYEIPIRLRYRRAPEGAVVWWYTPSRIDLVWDHATNEACDKVVSKTDLPLFLGKAEV